MKTNSLSFGERLKEQIKAKGYTRQQFADSIGVSTVTVQLWTSDKKKPTTEHLFRICEALNCDLDYLLGRIKEKTHDLQFVCDYTGLTSAAVEALKMMKNDPTAFGFDSEFFNAYVFSHDTFAYLKAVCDGVNALREIDPLIKSGAAIRLSKKKEPMRGLADLAEVSMGLDEAEQKIRAAFSKINEAVPLSEKGIINEINEQRAEIKKVRDAIIKGC